MSAWIRMISDEEADEALREALEQSKTPHGTVDNVLRVHSLRPKTMVGHIALYKSVLHDKSNTVPTWLLETVGSYVSIINECEYSISNHWANAEYLINDKVKSKKIEDALFARTPEMAFDGVELAILHYAEKLTLHPSKVKKTDVDLLSNLGIEDGEILEINQIISYFNYVNRTINGLGVSTIGDRIGFYSNSDDA